MSIYTMTIGGKIVAGRDSYPVINPATEEVLAQAPQATNEDVDDAIQLAHQAFKTWQVNEKLRRKLLFEAAKLIKCQREDLARLLTQEQGKPLTKSYAEIDGLVEQFIYAANLVIPCDVLRDDEERLVAVYRKPLGVVAAIAPWNYPLWSAGKIAIPLLLGNTVVIKPSPYTPLSTLRVGEILREHFPAGVINFVSGGVEVGQAMIKHPLVHKVSFTGSVRTGKLIAAELIDDLKRFTLELGGNDPGIVFADVNVKKVASKIFWGAFTNTGQICTAIKRLYVHQDVIDPLIDELTKLALNVKVGNGLLPETEIGPINNLEQLNLVAALVNDAKSVNATVLTGGQRIDRMGYFYPPTLVTNVKEGVALVDQEQFGPVLPIMSFHDEEEVIFRANATKLGLGATVWTKRWQHGMNIAKRIESGTVWVNHTFNTHDDAPFGGFKWSGIGREGGISSIDAYSEKQTLSIAKKA